MISNLDQQVDQKKFDEELDRIFYTVPIKWVSREELEELYPPKERDE